eukprot:6093393-Pleurochrysis_carterae.AAC.1
MLLARAQHVAKVAPLLVAPGHFVKHLLHIGCLPQRQHAEPKGVLLLRIAPRANINRAAPAMGKACPQRPARREIAYVIVAASKRRYRIRIF